MLTYDPRYVYTFHIYDHALDYSEFRIPFFMMDMVKVLDGQVGSHMLAGTHTCMMMYALCWAPPQQSSIAFLVA